MPCIEPQPRREQRLAIMEIYSRPADVPARRCRRPNRHRCAVPVRIFLKHDDVGTIGHRRTGEDPYAVARSQPAEKAPSGRAFADERQMRGHGSDILRTCSVAVHRRRVERRLCPGGGKRRGERPARPGIERDAFGAGARARTRKHPGQRIRHGQKLGPIHPP